MGKLNQTLKKSSERFQSLLKANKEANSAYEKVSSLEGELKKAKESKATALEILKASMALSRARSLFKASLEKDTLLKAAFNTTNRLKSKLAKAEDVEESETEEKEVSFEEAAVNFAKAFMENENMCKCYDQMVKAAALQKADIKPEDTDDDIHPEEPVDEPDDDDDEMNDPLSLAVTTVLDLVDQDIDLDDIDFEEISARYGITTDELIEAVQDVLDFEE